MFTREELVQKLNISNVNKVDQDRILSNVSQVVSDRLFVEIADKLSDEDLDKLNALIDQNKDGEVEWFIKGKFEHYDEFATKIEMDVINEMAEMNNQFGQTLDAADKSVQDALASEATS